jgi:fructose-bisphosphate aldolase class I
MLFTTPRLGEFISGIILFGETIRQKDRKGSPFSEIIRQQGIVPGIKVDQGTSDLANCPGEKITEGLDGLRERLREYVDLGARFTKWRAVIHIGESTPTRACLFSNAQVLARFAALSQEAGLLPIVEPEVLMDGNHSIKRCERVTEATLRAVFQQLSEHRVVLEALLLKCNMVTAGKEFMPQASPQEVAETTLRCLRRCVPAAVPGIVFLSGGQSETVATQNLNALNQQSNVPWPLSFSFGRALQNSALEAWKNQQLPVAQEALVHRARCNSAAREGQYSAEMENPAMAA